MRSDHPSWPALVYADWQDSCATLHLWTQVVGKIRLALAPPVNHWWHVPLYLTARGLTTSPMPYRGLTFQIDFDFIDHVLRIETSDGRRDSLALLPRSVADFYAEVMARLRALGIEVRIWPMPVEIADPIRLDEDRVHAAYDAAAVNRFWHALAQIDQVFTAFRARFIGKVSPVHFFWGGFDLAVSRFSGRRAPKHAPVPGVSQKLIDDAYSHECSSVGWWPGGNGVDASYFAYTYPEPQGLSNARVRPAAAAWSDALHEFILPYDAVRSAPNPEQALMDFCQSTYEAGADLARWPREELERVS
jgi:hypothetical protein